MKKFFIKYRDEFEIIVEAKDEEDAIRVAELKGKWAMNSEGHRDMYEVVELEKDFEKNDTRE